MGERINDRSQPPAAGATPEFRFPGFQIHTLDNGLQLYLSRYARGPLVHQLLILPGGGQQDPSDKAGLSSLTASVLDEGTSLRSSLDLAQEIESLGGYLSSQADWDAMSVSLGLLARHVRAGLGLLADIATAATFPDREVERLRSQHLAEMKRRQAQPSILASDALFRMLYEGTIYATPLIGTPATVTSIDRSEILETAQRELVPDGAALVVVGDIEPDLLLGQVEEVFAKWRGQARSEPAAVRPMDQEGLKINIIDRPHAPQTELWLGSIGVPRSHPDRAGLTVLNSLLGGKFTSRLNLNLRERLGITYGVSSSFSQRRGPGPFVVAASIDTESVDTAVREILTEIRRLQEEPVREAELADTKSYLSGIFPYTLQRIEGLAGRLSDLKTYDFAPDYFENFLRQIARVTRADLLHLAQKHLQPDAVSITAVGPRQPIESRLGPLASSVIHSDHGSQSEPTTTS